MNDIVKGSLFIIHKRKRAIKSRYELIIMAYLNDRCIKYKPEYYTKDGSLINPTTGKLLFIDFYLPKFKIAIEYDGLHHRVAVNGNEELINQKHKDNVKDKYCIENNIKLYRIKSTDIVDIEKDLNAIFESICGIRKQHFNLDQLLERNKNKKERKLHFKEQKRLASLPVEAPANRRLNTIEAKAKLSELRLKSA